MCRFLQMVNDLGMKFITIPPPLLTAFLWISVVADENFLTWRPEEWCPVDGVVEAQATVVEDVNVAGTYLVQRLELEGGDPTLLQDQQRNTTSTAGVVIRKQK